MTALPLVLALAFGASTTGADGVGATGNVTTTTVGTGLSVRLGGDLAAASGVMIPDSTLLSFGGGFALGYGVMPGLEFGWTARAMRSALSVAGGGSISGQTVGDQRLTGKYVHGFGTFDAGLQLSLDLPAPAAGVSVVDTAGFELSALGSMDAGPVRVHGTLGYRVDRSGRALAPGASVFETYALQQSLYDRLRVAAVGELPLFGHVAFASLELEQAVNGPAPVWFGAIPPRLGLGGRFAFQDLLALTVSMDLALGPVDAVPRGLPVAAPFRLLVAVASAFDFTRAMPAGPAAPSEPIFDDDPLPVPVPVPEPAPTPQSDPPTTVVEARPPAVEPPPTDVATTPSPTPEPVDAPAPAASTETAPAAPAATETPPAPPTAAELGARFKLAVELQKESAFMQAAEALEFVAKHAPRQSPELLYNLGYVHRMSGDHDRAIDEFSRFLDASPPGPKVAEVEKFLLELSREKRRDAAAGGDIYPPRIAHKVPAGWKAGTPLRIEVEVTDRTGVFEVTLYYRFGGSSFVQLPLVRDAGTNRFGASLPPLPAGLLEWYVDAVDAQGNLARAGTTSHPYPLQVE